MKSNHWLAMPVSERFDEGPIMQTFTSIALQHAFSRRTLGRILLVLLAGSGFGLGACTSTSSSSERFLVLESQKFT